jgi:hypothetical protein
MPGTNGGVVLVCPVGPVTGGVVVGPVGTVGDCGGATLSITMDVSGARGPTTGPRDSRTTSPRDPVSSERVIDASRVKERAVSDFASPMEEFSSKPTRGRGTAAFNPSGSCGSGWLANVPRETA